MNEHIKIEYNEQYNFNKVTCIEGHLITNWDGQDIKSYTASTIMYAPTNVVFEDYYCVPEEEHIRLMELQVMTIEKEMLKNEDKIEADTIETDIISGTTE